MSEAPFRDFVGILLGEKCPNTEFFLSVFSYIQSKCRKIRTWQKSVSRHFSRIVFPNLLLLLVFSFKIFFSKSAPFSSEKVNGLRNDTFSRIIVILGCPLHSKIKCQHDNGNLLRERCPNMEFFPVRIFLNSTLIRRFTE